MHEFVYIYTLCISLRIFQRLISIPFHVPEEQNMRTPIPIVCSVHILIACFWMCSQFVSIRVGFLV
jgi:hypothetical protein